MQGMLDETDPLKGPVQDRAFAGVHAIKTNIWRFGTVNPKQFRSVQLSKIKRISTIVMLIIVILIQPE